MIRGHSDGTIRGYWKASSMLALQATVSQDLGITTVVSSGIKCKLKVFKKRKPIVAASCARIKSPTKKAKRKKQNLSSLKLKKFVKKFVIL